MSLLSPSARIALTPTRVALLAGGARRDALVATPGWPGALETLSGLLAGATLRGRASVRLSHHFASVHLLAAAPVALKPQEMQGWILDQLGRQFGESGRDRRVAWQPEPRGEPFLAGSIEPGHLAELEVVLRAASLKPADVQPWLVSAWNRHRRQLGRGRAWFALAEPGRLTLLGLDAGRARSLRSLPVESDGVGALAALLTREALLAGEDDAAPVWVEAVDLEADWRALPGGRAVHVLSQGRDALAAMLER
ncbi:MAG: hypothetical protein ACK4UX_09780 [Thiobacillus sp.]